MGMPPFCGITSSGGRRAPASYVNHLPIPFHSAPTPGVHVVPWLSLPQCQLSHHKGTGLLLFVLICQVKLSLLLTLSIHLSLQQKEEDK